MATLKEYLNAKIKSKGSSFSKEKARAKNYKSISAAKKAGALYYTNKAGKVMAAVYAEDLKSSPAKTEPKSPVSIKKPGRPKPRPKTLVKSSAPVKSGRPKASTLRAKPKASSAEVKVLRDIEFSKVFPTGSRKTILTKGQKPKKSTTIKPKSSNTIAKRAQSEVKIKTAGPKKAMSLAERTRIAANARDMAKTRRQQIEGSTATRSRKPKKLTGLAWMKTHTFADYMDLTMAEAKALGLPKTRLAAVGTKFADVNKFKFKDGKGFFGK